MAKYRKKPITIEAEQWFPGKQIEGVVLKSGPAYTIPYGDSYAGGPGIQVPVIETPEGEMRVSEGDYIITGVKGERYPCKPDIFAATYETPLTLGPFRPDPRLRQIHGHECSGCNASIGIQADPLGNGGASHQYAMFSPVDNPDAELKFFQGLSFQDGPIKEVGNNGITHEVLLTIIKDRLECFQAGPYRCIGNQEALQYVNMALAVLYRRTILREQRGVEGTSEL